MVVPRVWSFATIPAGTPQLEPGSYTTYPAQYRYSFLPSAKWLRCDFTTVASAEGYAPGSIGTVFPDG